MGFVPFHNVCQPHHLFLCLGCASARAAVLASHRQPYVSLPPRPVPRSPPLGAGCFRGHRRRGPGGAVGRGLRPKPQPLAPGRRHARGPLRRRLRGGGGARLPCGGAHRGGLCRARRGPGANRGGWCGTFKTENKEAPAPLPLFRNPDELALFLLFFFH